MKYPAEAPCVNSLACPQHVQLHRFAMCPISRRRRSSVPMFPVRVALQSRLVPWLRRGPCLFQIPAVFTFNNFILFSIDECFQCPFLKIVTLSKNPYLLSRWLLNVDCVGFISLPGQRLVLTLHSYCQLDSLSRKNIFQSSKLKAHLTLEESLVLKRIFVTSLIVGVHEIEVLAEDIGKLVDPLVHLETSCWPAFTSTNHQPGR